MSLSFCVLFSILVNFQLKYVNTRIAPKFTANCSLSDVNVDKSATHLFTFSEQQIYKTRDATQEMDNYCSSLKENFKILEDYIQCQSSIPLPVIADSISSLESSVSNRCTQKYEREKFIIFSSCVYIYDVDNEIKDCIKTAVSQLNFISNNVSSGNRISSTCCTFNLFVDCMKSSVANVCPKVKGIDLVLYTEHFIFEALGSLYETYCSEFEQLFDCFDSHQFNSNLDVNKQQEGSKVFSQIFRIISEHYKKASSNS